LARKVFFSFHYQRDVFRVMQVRNSWIVRSKGEATPFYDKADFEEVKRRSGGIERWIEQQLSGTSVTVVLFGAETANRPWVRHEIKRSVQLGKGLLAIDIHRVKDLRIGADYQGRNPLSTFTYGPRDIPLTQLYSTYDWVLDDGYTNMPRWIETAARAVGR
jgi:hypothetical protein